eukprot:TRINITY_DN489_c0_g1_i1.p1 TRINITY_DN489_c0_g1~~TRINITY_DN489_c0_g1_i1.p1  ORF type:complete len:500 (+),score=137.46 TRINITY_DN489_c0_g1_i1:249-1748(+)
MAGLSEFQHSKGLFSISYPTGWEVVENDVVTSFTAPVAADTLQPTSMNVAIVPMEGQLSLEEIAAKAVAEIQYMPQFKIISNKNATISGHPAKLLQYYADIPQFGEKAAFFQSILMSPQGYLVTTTFSGLESSLKNYGQFIFKCIESLTLSNVEISLPIEFLYLVLHRNENLGFELKAPMTWAVTDITNNFENSRLLSATELKYCWKQTKGDVLLEGLVVVENVQSNTTLDQYFKEHEKERTKELSLPNVTMNPYTANKTVKLGSVQGRYLMYIDPVTDQKTWRLMTIKDSKAFVLSFFSTAPLDDNREHAMIVRILESFRFVSPNEPTPPASTIFYEHLLLNFGLTFDAQRSPPSEHMAAVLSLAYVPVGTMDPNGLVLINFFAAKLQQPDISLDEFSDQTTANLKKELFGAMGASADFKIVSTNKNCKLGSSPAIEVAIEANIEGTLFKLTRRVALKEDKAFTVTVEGRSMDLTDRVTTDASKIVDTFYFFSPSQFI